MSTPTLQNVTTEGGLLPADLLERVRSLDPDLPALRPENYGLAPGERITDAIVRSWTRLTGLWQSFADALEVAPASDATFQAKTRTHWLMPLFEELGFGQPEPAQPVVFDDGLKTYPVSHRSSDIALHLIGARVELDRRGPHGERPAHGMVQEFLNRSDDHLWAIVTNGRRLRVLRDSSSLTRQAFCEFDLEAMFRGGEYADWALCWLVCHASRFRGDTPADCVLEQWSNQARTEGTRALDRLQSGVEKAIVALGSGFLADQANTQLRARLESGELSVVDYHRQLLRLVYRLIFLLVAEARDLLHGPGVDDAARERYRRWYSLGRIVELAEKRRGTRHGDLWVSLQVVFDALAGPGQSALGLTGLGSALWSAEAIGDLRSAQLSNRALLDAMFQLSTVTHEGRGRGRSLRRTVDYRHLGAEELGSVYEALLELHPRIEGRRFTLQLAAGNERKTTGSYYTPTPLIRELLTSALDPVLDEASAAANPEEAILNLKVLDPAAGSGHFLIAAAHRIAHRLAAVRSQEDEPSPGDLRVALREVIGRCIYGVDVNPMAVELCKVSLWMEATQPGMPLSFLDHRVVCGNSLLGTTPALLADGLPDAAFAVLEGDDKKHVASLKRTNKSERKQIEGQGLFDFGGGVGSDTKAVAKELAVIDAMPDRTAQQVAAKEAAYADLRVSQHAERARFGADAWCAAFVAPKQPEDPILTDKEVRLCRDHPDRASVEVHDVVRRMKQQYNFLHLHVAFPDVFEVPDNPDDAANERCGWSGGFDAVLGNPPWDKVEFSETEYFASRDPNVASLPGAKRKTAITHLAADDPLLHEAYRAALRQTGGERTLMASTGRFPLCGLGRINTYAVFAELMSGAMSAGGRVGVVVPTGIATDDTTKLFFGDLVDRKALVSLFDFENRNGVFPGVHRSYKFCLLTLSGHDRPVDEAEFVFFALEVADLTDVGKRFTLTPDDFALLNPNTRTCPVFRTRRDAEITKAVYRRVPVLVNEADPEHGNPWGLSFRQGLFNMTSDSGLFKTRDDLEVDGWTLQGNHFVRGDERFLPLCEAKMIHHFDHRWATHEGLDVRKLTLDEKQDPTFVALPRYWVVEEEISKRAEGRYLAGWRKICRSTDERTFISTSIPLVGAGDNLLLYWTEDPSSTPYPVMSSFVFDFIARQKLGGSNFQYFTAKQLPLVPAEHLEGTEPWTEELTYTAWDMSEFAADLGFHGPPFRWDVERRALLRAELDALVFRLYGIERDDVDYILDTFPIVRRKDEAEFGEFRTKRLILERFDAMESADAAGEEYQTALDPPPADPSLCHPESTRPAWAQPAKPARSEQ